ncbi:hypothetical protein [uncultured Legionella sp.]|mgnify:CR=1 FL=1|uniref:hypothetical protein n=1 Tax=uncultured Legionella sp. TaxID=210934 RepID=UPI002638D5D1|nr:hypothetical protein [uncultured Legionella sp.]
MPKNQALKAALANKDILMTVDPAVREKALDDLLKADSKDTSQVRLAIITNKAFWELFPDLTVTDGDDFYTDSRKLLSPSGVLGLRQAAAEQRVLLGLKDVKDDVLINILSNNQDECRAYLASKPELGTLQGSHGWRADEVPDPSIQPPPPPSNKTTNILSNAAVDEIQMQSRDLLLSRLIENNENKAFLVQLLTATDKPILEAAANNLGYPQELNDKITHPLSDEVKTTLKQRMTVLKQTEGKAAFTTHVESLTSDILLKKNSLLEENAQDFYDGLPPNVKMYMDIQQVDWAKGVLGARYLQAHLAHTEENVLPALNATNENDFKVKLKAMAGVGDHPYVDHAVIGNLAAMKKALLQSHISNQINGLDALNNLDKAADLDQFRRVLTTAGVTSVDWINESDLKEMKQWVRSHLFECQLNLISQLGAKPHTQLAKVFANLPVEKQRSLLADPIHHYHVLNATDVNSLQTYLGKGTPGLDTVVAENKSLAVFQQIQNATVAKILVNFKPAINLAPARIKEINKELRESAMAMAATDLKDPANYKALIDKIRPHCGPVDAGLFYEAFGLNNNGLAFKADTSLRDGIIKQNTHNLALLPAFILLPDNDPNKKLLGVFLTLNKESALDPQAIKDKFKTAKTYKEFIEGVAPTTALRARFIAQLSSQLSSTMFYDLKVNAINRKVLSNSSRVVNEGITAIHQEIDAVQKSREVSTDSKKHFKFIDKIEPNYLYNPTFRGEARLKAVEMKDKYQSLSDDCDAIVEQLKRNQSKLENFFNLRGSLDPGLSQADKDKLTEVNEKLVEELAAIKSDLRFYERIQNKLSGTNGILSAINDAADNKKAYVFHAEGVTRKFVTREGLAELSYTSSAPTTIPGSAIATEVDESASNQQFKLSGHVVPEGQIEAVDVVRTDYKDDGVTKSYETVGRYTIDRSPPTPVTVEGEKINKTPGAKVEVREFPKQTIPVPAANSPADAKLRQERIKFALTVAAEALALLDGPPTKEKPLCLYGSNEEEMRHLWTALIILGEKNPHLKFSEEAIKLDRFGDNQFDPAKERKSSIFGFKRDFHNLSLYYEMNSLAHQSEVDRKSAVVNEMSKAKMGQFEQRSKVDPQAMEAAAALKKNNKELRKQVNETKDAEEPVVRNTGPNNA